MALSNSTIAQLRTNSYPVLHIIIYRAVGRPVVPDRRLIEACLVFDLSGAPCARINRLSPGADLEIDPGHGLSTAVTTGSYGFAGIDPVTGLLDQGFIVSIEAHVALAMVNNSNKTIAL